MYIGTIPTPAATESRQEWIATAGQTVFPSTGGTVGYADLFVNGVKMANSDFTFDGADFTLTTGAAAGDVVNAIMRQADNALVALPIKDSAGNNVISEANNVVSIADSVVTNPTMADTWYLNADQTSTGVIGGNNTSLARWGLGGYFSGFGNPMTQSSGVFTFPDTGYYLVTAQGYLQSTSSGGVSYVGLEIRSSNDGGSNWNSYSFGYANMYAASNYGYVTLKQIFVVTNTATHKIRFEMHRQNSNAFVAGGADLRTNFQFIRLRSI